MDHDSAGLFYISQPMKIITTISEMQSLAGSLRREGRTIGFVPTMGFLHGGHVSLIQRARQECDVVVVSIFVNPIQFGPGEDFEHYPRDEDGDRTKCESAGVDVLFVPTTVEMCPEKPSDYITVPGISDILEGAVRPGHFRGVATVVAKFFNIVKPYKAFFGQKDYQQCAVIKRMVKDLNMDVKVVVLPTMREKDGLAMSSRNSYLNADERLKATVIHRALTSVEHLIMTGVKDPEKLKNAAQLVLSTEQGVVVDYLEIVDPETLAPLVSAKDSMVLLVAVRLGSTRLIDNLVIQ